MTEHVHLAFPATDGRGRAGLPRRRDRGRLQDNGAPGERADYHPGYYGAFVFDPDGNNVEVVNHNR